MGTSEPLTATSSTWAFPESENSCRLALLLLSLLHLVSLIALFVACLHLLLSLGQSLFRLCSSCLFLLPLLPRSRGPFAPENERAGDVEDLEERV